MMNEEKNNTNFEKPAEKLKDELSSDNTVNSAVAKKHRIKNPKRFIAIFCLMLFCLALITACVILSIQNKQTNNELTYFKDKSSHYQEMYYDTIHNNGNFFSDYSDNDDGASEDRWKGIVSSRFADTVNDMANYLKVDKSSIEYSRPYGFEMCPYYLTFCFFAIGESFSANSAKITSDSVTYDDVISYFEENGFEQIEKNPNIEATDKNNYIIYVKDNFYYTASLSFIDNDIRHERYFLINGFLLNENIVPIASSNFANDLNKLAAALLEQTELKDDAYDELILTCLHYDNNSNDFVFPACDFEGSSGHDYIYNNSENRIIELAYGLFARRMNSISYGFYRDVDATTGERSEWKYYDLHCSSEKNENEFFYCAEPKTYYYEELARLRDGWILLSSQSLEYFDIMISDRK